MSALTTERNTPNRDAKSFGYPVAANVKVYQGSLVVLTHAGVAKGAVEALNLAGVGRANETVDNTGGLAGAKTVAVERGCFRFTNAGDVTLGHVGDAAYAVDDQTVSADSNTNTRSQVGVIRDVDSLGVWVEI